jgi:hypothetical protein
MFSLWLERCVGVVSKERFDATAPAVPMGDLSGALVVFRDALDGMTQGGMQATAVKNAARAVLLDLLRQEANYVEGLAMGDMAMLLSSGFAASSKNRTQEPLVKPVIQRIANKASTQLAVRVGRVKNAAAFEVRTSTGTSAPQPAGTFTQSRRIILTSLTPGTTYIVQTRAVGGSTGYSDWSDPVSHMAL